MGRATICVPRSGNRAEMRETGLSDQVAMSYGTLFARTLSEQDGYVTVTLQSGSVIVIGYDTAGDKLTIGRIKHYWTIVLGSDNMIGHASEHPIKDTPVTIIGHTEKVGILTGRSKPGRRCELWQCYWTYNPTGSDNLHQWVPCDQVIRR